MTTEQFYAASETHQTKMVFPGTLNANQTLFGGDLLKWMDEVAFITATRVTRQRIFTARVDAVEFLKPIPENSIADVVGSVKQAGPVKMVVEVNVFNESLYEKNRSLVAKATFTMIALNEKDQPTRLALPALPAVP